MLSFLHALQFLNNGDIIKLDCDTPCNFIIMSNTEFRNYRNGKSYKYYGRHTDTFPAYITVPNSDNWNIVIDLGGGTAKKKILFNKLQTQIIFFPLFVL